MSKESAEQGESGRRGSEASQQAGAGSQPRQGAQRTESQPRGDSEPEHHFEAGRAPSEQGEQGSPSPETIREHQQGFRGTGAGHQGGGDAHSDRSQEASTQGPPREGHTRDGRQQTPGDRNRS